MTVFFIKVQAKLYPDEYKVAIVVCPHTHEWKPLQRSSFSHNFGLRSPWKTWPHLGGWFTANDDVEWCARKASFPLTITSLLGGTAKAKAVKSMCKRLLHTHHLYMLWGGLKLCCYEQSRRSSSCRVNITQHRGAKVIFPRQLFGEEAEGEHFGSDVLWLFISCARRLGEA